MEVGRDYRNYENKTEFKFNITVKETDIFFITDKNVKQNALLSILKYRKLLENHISLCPEFLTSLKPLELPCLEIHPFIKDMYIAGMRANVGPFASVAGAISEYVARDLLKCCNQVIVENGGDIFLSTSKERIIRLKGKNNLHLGIKLSPKSQPIAICSSSSKIGHSLSFGKADLVTVLSKKGSIADAFATSICNKIKNEKDLQNVLNNVRDDLIIGIIAIINGKIAIKGDINLVKLI